MKKVVAIIITTIVVICVIAGTMFYNGIGSRKDRLYALGYSNEEVEKFINEHGTSEFAKKAEDKLLKSIEKKEQVLLDEIGVPAEFVNGRDSLSKVEYNDYLDEYIETTRQMYLENINNMDAELVALRLSDEDDYSSMNLVEQFDAKNKKVVARRNEINGQYNSLVQGLYDIGVRETEVQSYLTGDIFADIETLNNKTEYFKSFAGMLGSSGTSYASGAMDLFNALNAHRVSKGLAPFVYRGDQQSCVDMETVAYAQNKNPHNWLCKSLTSEGSSLASSSSDYIGIAANFLTTHDSHEADVINPRYVGAACSVVNKDRMNYMICGYFQ